MKYKIIQEFGKYKIGQIVDDSDIYIRRKIREDGCLEAIEEKIISDYEDKSIKTYSKKSKEKGEIK